MKRLCIAVAALVLVAHSIFAASPAIEVAIDALAKIEADAAKFREYCRITKELATATDAARSEDLTEQMDDLLGALGSDVMMAVYLARLVDPKTEDGMALENAMDGLDEKCAK
jgi:hypothetical protein